MNNKKGFTLIELITVIIVLSIVALIATPVVTGIMEASRKKAYDSIVTNIEDSAYKYSIYNNLGYSELYKPLQLEEIQKSGYLESKDIIDPRNNEKMEGCIAYKWDVEKNQYDFVYQEECDPQSLFPKVEIGIPNISDIDNKEWLQERIQFEVEDAYRSYKYCIGREKCTPDKDYTGKTTVQETGRNIYICVTGFMGEDEGLTACVGPYNVDPDKPILTLKEVKTLSSRITVNATCTDDISQVKSLQYSINDGEYQNSSVFKNLKSGKYNVKVRCIDNALHEVTASKEVTLDVIPVPEITQLSQKPEDTDTYPKYASERVIRITYYNENVQSPKYYYSIDGNEWVQTTKTIVDLPFTKNGKVYAKTTDEAGNIASAATYSIVNMDTTIPNTSLTITEWKSDRAKLTASCSDDISGIVKYEFSKDNGSTWIANGTNKIYTFTGLKSGTTYNFVVRCTNGAALTNTAKADGKPSEITIAKIEQISEKPGGTPYATQRVFRITYSDANVVSPKFYYSLDGSTWTELTSGKTIDLTFTANGKIYAKTVDPAGNIANAVTFVVTKMDTTAPSASLKTQNIKTDRVTLVATCSDNESGISKYEFSKDNGSTWVANGTTSSYTFTGLKHGTNYNFAVRCTNNSGMTKTASTGDTPTLIPAPIITQLSEKPGGTEYAQSRTIRITYYNTNVEGAKYYYSTDGSTWNEVTSATKDIEFTKNGKVYAKTEDVSQNKTEAATYVVGKIDATAPSLTLGKDTVSTNSATIPYTASDTESGIKSTTCVYGTSTSYGSNGTISSSSCKISNLTAETTYYYKIVTTNGSGMAKEVTGSFTTFSIINPKLTITSTPTTAVNGYYKKHVAAIIYPQENILEPQFFLKTTSTASSSVALSSCGNGTNPGSCSTSNTTTLSAGYWYKVSGNVNITYQAATSSNTTLYALTYDGNNYSGAVTATLGKIDATAPTISVSNTSSTATTITLPFTASDPESGIKSTTCVYGTSTSYGSNGTISGNSCLLTGLTAGTTYYYKITTTNGLGDVTTSTGSKGTISIVNPKITQESATIASGYTWATQRVYKITYDSNSPANYFKSSVAATVASGVVTHSCGTGNSPGTCSASSVTTLAANTWYKTSSTTPTITYASNGTLYAMSIAGTNLSSTMGVAQTSNGTPTAPTITGGSDSFALSRTISVSTASTETSGINKYQYCISTSSSSCNGTWINTATSTTSQSILTEGTRYIFFRSVANNGKPSNASNYQVTKIDTTGPNCTISYNSGSNTCTWKNNYSINVNCTDSGSGIAKYQIDWDGDGASDYEFTSNVFVPWNGYHSHNTRFRAVDNLGNPSSTWSSEQHIHMDTEAPATPTVKFNTGANSCSWKNNYNMTFSATDNVGILKFQIDHDNNGTVDREYTASSNAYNFIPESGYTTCYDRYRSVDHAGNVSAWTSVHHIHQDTTLPTVTASSSGKTATFTIKDNISAIGYGVNQSSSTQPSYTTISGTTSTAITWTASAGGTYYVWVKDQAGNVNKASFTIAASAFNYAATNASYTATASCESGYTLSGSTCSKTWQSGTSYSCPSGGTLSGTTCTISGSYGATKGCSTGTLSGDTCNYSCSGTCYKTGSDQSSTAVGCDIACSTRPSGCTITSIVQGSCSNTGTCNLTCYWKYPYSCTKTCSSSSYITYSCPSGGSLSGTTCYTSSSYGATGTPTYSTDTKSATYSCPNGGTLSGTTCVKYTCPNGGTLSGTTCTF